MNRTRNAVNRIVLLIGGSVLFAVGTAVLTRDTLGKSCPEPEPRRALWLAGGRVSTPPVVVRL